MKEIILVVCLAAITLAIPRREHGNLVGVSSLTPEELRREIIPEDILAPQIEELNFDDVFAPDTVAINFVDSPPQQALQDIIELVKVSQQAFGVYPEKIKIAPFPLNHANVEPIYIENLLPAAYNYFPPENVVHKVSVVDNENTEADKVQVVDVQSKEDGVKENIEKEVESIKIEDIPIQEQQNEAVRVASIPTQNSENVSPDADKFWGVKFVETPNTDADALFVGIPAPIAPSELDSLRVDFNKNPAPISLSDAKQPRPIYPNNLYDDPMLR